MCLAGEREEECQGGRLPHSAGELTACITHTHANANTKKETHLDNGYGSASVSLSRYVEISFLMALS